VYRALPDAGYPPRAPLDSLPEGTAPPWRNDLTDAAIRVCPPLAEVREALRATGGEPLLCGSGSCWAARYTSTSSRDTARDALRAERSDWSLWAV
jgi:4-diphosphocytidyl-2-C-methyl-D-erythritol kinase